eukprot:tig00021035_g17268.t1
MELRTVAGGNTNTAVPENDDGVGTGARIAAVRAAAWDSVTGDLYLGVGYGLGFIFRITTGNTFLKPKARLVINQGSLEISDGVFILE